MLSTSTKNRLKYALANAAAANELDSLLSIAPAGDIFYVDTVNGQDTNDGSAWDAAFATVAKAFTKITSDYSVVVANGDIREQATTPAYNYCQVIAASGNPRGARWRAPASATATTPLLLVRQRGWVIRGFLFNAPTDAAAVQCFRDATYNAQDTVIEDCEFNTGAIAIEAKGAPPNVIVRRNRIHDMTSGSVTTSGAIICTSTATALPQRWVIEDNLFLNNANHISAGLKIGTIRRNVFTDIGDSITSTVVIDLSANGGGDHNFLSENQFGGTYSATLYKKGTADNWNGNYGSAGLTTGSGP